MSSVTTMDSPHSKSTEAAGASSTTQLTVTVVSTSVSSPAVTSTAVLAFSVEGTTTVVVAPAATVWASPLTR